MPEGWSAHVPSALGVADLRRTTGLENPRPLGTSATHERHGVELSTLAATAAAP